MKREKMGKEMTVLDAEFALLEAEANGLPIKMQTGSRPKEKCPKCGAVGVLGTDYEADDLRLTVRFCVACHNEWRGAICTKKS